MYGTIGGDILGILYFLAYQVLGSAFARLFIQRERKEFQLLIGSITGSVALHWCPTIFSMFMDFTIQSHILGLVLFAVIVLGIYLAKPVRNRVCGENATTDPIGKSLQELIEDIKETPIFWILMALTAVLFYVLVFSHTIPTGSGGEMRTGQCTYSDMNLHLGIITSIANQHTFPPDYSILPGSKLCYPFLCDSVSASIYVFGASLRLAYILPMLLAILQVFLGFYLLAKAVLKSGVKATVAWILFFFNGGLGFAYFCDLVQNNGQNFTRIFTAYYETPTNNVNFGIYWVNVIVDMLLPQRSTLFGWAVLFGTLALLYRAMITKNKRYFVLVGIFGGAMPMIHTHSFLSLAMVCLVWVTGYMYQMAGYSMEGRNKVAAYLIPIGLVAMSAFQASSYFRDHIEVTGPVVVCSMLAVAIGLILFLLYKVWTLGKFKELFLSWGLVLIIVAVMALPQLMNWTFQQASNGGFLRGYFNWSNANDQYIWFYLKNLGIAAVFAIPALVYAKKKKFLVAAPAFLIWPVAELVEFQLNVYDNNKLLYVAYALVMIICADFLVKVFLQINAYAKIGSYVLTGTVLVVCVASAVLTMGREYASGAEYELYGVNQVAVSQFIEENTDADAVVLTNTRHNNAISSLTGRNLVCGSGTFLCSHGLDYSEQEAAANAMYTVPEQSQQLFADYGVSYILVGPDERNTYAVDEAGIQAIADCVFSQEDVQLYKLR